MDLQRGRIKAWQRCPARDEFVYGNPFMDMAEFRMTGDTVRARQRYEKFLATPAGERNTDLYPATIALLADVGRVAGARRLLDDWRARGSNDPGFRGDSAQAVRRDRGSRGAVGSRRGGVPRLA